MPVKDAITTVLHRNTFYRDGYRVLLRVSLIQTVIIGLLILAIVGLALTVKTRSVYFATTSDGRIINIVPLNDPYLTPARVIAWTASAVQNIMRFGYHDYRARLQYASDYYFTSTGWASFDRALKAANFMEAVKARKLVVTLQINGAPEIQSEFENKGVYTWYVHVPVTIKFDGEQPPQPISTKLRLQVVRVSTLQNPDGVSIEQWVPISTGARR